jgi:transposase
MTVWRALRKLQFTRKKKLLREEERDRPDVHQQRRRFQQAVATLDAQRLVFVDELGGTTAVARLCGCAPEDERVYGHVPGSWDALTLISGLLLGGVVAPLAFPGATDTDAFRTYADGLLAPQLHQGAVVIWDNLKKNKDAAVVEAVERVGARMFSKVKGVLRTLAARTTGSLVEAMGAALRRVCAKDALGWFRSCGLALNRTRKLVQSLLHRLRSGNCAQPAWEAIEANTREPALPLTALLASSCASRYAPNYWARLP